MPVIESPYAVDVWSVGCVMFELFTGMRLFVPPAPALLTRIMNDDDDDEDGDDEEDEVENDDDNDDSGDDEDDIRAGDRDGQACARKRGLKGGACVYETKEKKRKIDRADVRADTSDNFDQTKHTNTTDIGVGDSHASSSRCGGSNGEVLNDSTNVHSSADPFMQQYLRTMTHSSLSALYQLKQIEVVLGTDLPERLLRKGLKREERQLFSLLHFEDPSRPSSLSSSDPFALPLSRPLVPLHQNFSDSPLDQSFFALLSSLLRVDASQRITARQALSHPYFSTK